MPSDAIPRLNAALELESGFAQPTDWLEDHRILASWRSTRDHRGHEWATWYSIGPFWDHNEDVIHYWEGGAVWSVRVADGPAGPRLGNPTREVPLDGDDRLFGVHPDGRVLVGLFYEEDELAPPPRLMLVTDLASELRAIDSGR